MTTRKPTKWGGLARRYETHRFSAIRFKDPTDGSPLEFGNDLDAECWHLYRFDPQVANLSAGDAGIVREINGRSVCGRELAVQATLASGLRVIAVTSKEELEAADLSRLRRLAKFNGASVRVHTRDELRAASTLINNLRTLRQRMTMHRSPVSDQRIFDLIPEGESIHQGQLAAALPDMSSTLIDGRLGHLFRAGRVHLELKEVRYGSETAIARV